MTSKKADGYETADMGACRDRPIKLLAISGVFEKYVSPTWLSSDRESICQNLSIDSIMKRPCSTDVTSSIMQLTWLTWVLHKTCMKDRLLHHTCRMTIRQRCDVCQGCMERSYLRGQPTTAALYKLGQGVHTIAYEIIAILTPVICLEIG